MNSWAGELSISQGKGSHYKSRLGLGTGGALLGSHSAASPVLVGLVDQLGSDGRCTSGLAATAASHCPGGSPSLFNGSLRRCP